MDARDDRHVPHSRTRRPLAEAWHRPHRLRRRVALAVLTICAVLAPLSGHAIAQGSQGPIMYPSGVGADLGESPTTLGIRPSAGDNPDGLQTGTLDGRSYWKTNHAAGTTYFRFELDPDFTSRLDTTELMVSLTYRDEGTGALVLWDEPASGESPRGEFALADTGEWRTQTLALHGEVPEAFRVELASESPERDFLVSSIRVGAVGASVELGPTPVQSGITPRAGDNPAGLVTGVLDGRGYWKTNHAAPPPATTYLYMNVADTFAYDVRARVLVSVDYYAAGTGRFRLQYDSPGDELADMFKNSEVVAYDDTQSWQTYTFTLEDAIMTNRSNGSDFRISTDGEADLAVAAVRVAIVAAELDPTEGLRKLITEAERVHRTAREGDRDGQYPEGSKAELAAAIDAAQQVVDRPDATEEEIKAALHALDDALQSFLASVIDTNIAEGAEATASSSAAGSSPASAVDGDSQTAWTSDSGTSGEWLQIDLGKAQPVNDVRVVWGTPASPDYVVEVSADGEHYTAVGQHGANSGQLIRTAFENTKARFVRVTTTGYAEGADRVAIRELQVRNERVVRPDPVLVKTRYPTEDLVVADFDVADYGADPTGVADSTKAIQNALYDCYDAGGGTVWLGAGTYRVTDTLEVHAFCTLRGDRRDPDRGRGDYGTVVLADLPPGDDGPVLFRIGGSAGVMGVTTYYPRQSATDPVPYNYTFEIPGGAWIGTRNYMMATVSDVTMLNSYRGIGISTMPSDSGAAPSGGQVHESSTIRNVKGTVLYEGVRAYNGADVGTWENVRFNNSYWAEAERAFNPPRRTDLDAWTRAHGTGFVLGDLEWEQLYRIEAEDYATGIKIVPGQRISFAGSFVEPSIRRTDVALEVEHADARWGLVVAGGRLQGSTNAIANHSDAFVKVTGTKLDGGTQGTVHVMSGKPPTYEPKPLPKPSRARLYDATTEPFNAPRGVGYVPSQDATAQIQRALDRAGAEGGGIVYLPAGWYRIESRLRVPAKVELRGASPVPNRDQLGASGGTVLLAYEGRQTDQPETAPALVTLDGDRAGVRGLRVFYPENNPASPDGLVPYPYAIRAVGTGTYVVNVGLPNAWNGVDLSSPRSDRFVVRKLTGAIFRHAVTVGPNAGGRIEGVLSNGNAVMRVGYALPRWAIERDVFPLVIDKYMRRQAQLISVDGARDLTVLNAFGYGFHDGLTVDSGQVTAWNFGTDNLGEDGYTVRVRGDGSADVTVTNLLRYNGTTSTGPARLLNIMVINMVQHSVSVAAAPQDGGTVEIAGNETEPGRYEAGSQVTVTARAARGYTFQHWSLDGDVISQDPTVSVTVDRDLTLTATFAPKAT